MIGILLSLSHLDHIYTIIDLPQLFLKYEPILIPGKSQNDLDQEVCED